MPTHHEQQVLPYTTSQLYALVKDVARYPEFLPWCKAARVSDVNEQGFLGELVICYKQLCERYTSRITLTPPVHDSAPCAIDVTLERGPFSHLTNRWQFVPEGQGTRIIFDLDFAFKIRLLEKVMGSFFLRANEKMMAAFKDRATQLYAVPS